ncbi:hypothetical protein FACS189440_01480 [Bacteroidia bacterium]|nr:hypothetical protein FACS189423_08420 [Bacteroidia bacterium]GHT45448.1 hypothetical protein FACS189440_01480 [Bacteroidia bacterium]
MEENNSIIWSDIAMSDLDSILEYISQNSSEERSRYVLNGIKKAVNNIYPFPYKFPRELSYNRDDVRYTVKWRYKIVYKIFSNHVEIARVFHSAQNPSKLMQY